jgi:3-isopropylmalate/(R)-2-methylmalate dehydratase small subunit
VVSTSIADIFRNNALKNGLLPVVVERGVHDKLLATPGVEVTVDLESQTLVLLDGTSARFPIDPFARYCLLNGVDELAFLLSQDEAIAAFEKKTS